MTPPKPTCKSVLRQAVFLTETGLRRMWLGDLAGAAESLSLAADMLALASELANEEAARMGRGNRKRHCS